MFVWRFILLWITFGILSSCSSEDSPIPAPPPNPPIGNQARHQVWIHPNSQPDLTTIDGFAIFDHLDQWSEARNKNSENDQVLQLFECSIGGPEPKWWSLPNNSCGTTKPGFTLSSLKKAVPQLKKDKVAIAIEAFGLWNWSCGLTNGQSVAKNSADLFLNHVQPLYDAGGSITYVALDSPTARVMKNDPSSNNCQFSLDRAVQELTAFLKAVHLVHPEIKFGLIVNLPNEVYAGTPCYFPNTPSAPHICSTIYHGGVDYQLVLDTVVREARAQGEEYYFLHADNPFEFTTGHNLVDDVYKQRLIPLRKQAEALHLRFGKVINSDLGKDDYLQTLSQTSCNADEIFLSRARQDLLNYAALADASTEGNMIFESWYDWPHSILPENTPFTFMNSANQIVDLFQNALAAKDDQVVPVFRLASLTTDVHFYTAGDPHEMLCRNQFKSESVGFLGYLKSVATAVPVYRLYKKANKDYLFTIQENEVINAKLSGYSNEGVVFYELPIGSENCNPVFRLRKKSNDIHFLTASQAESDSLVKGGLYALEGVAFCSP